MRKLLSLAVAAALSVGMMTGCQNKTTSSGSTTVRVWTTDAGGKSVWEKLVKEFNDTTGKEKGIKIEWTTYSSDFLTSLEVARKNDQLPEIAAISDVSGYSKTGDVLPLEDMPGGKEFIEEYGIDLVQGRNIIGDVVYNVPSTSNVPALVYNKDLFKAAGLVDSNGEALPPQTWEEVREYAKRLPMRKKQVYGLGIPLKEMSLYCNYMLRPSFASSYGEMAVYDFDNITVSYDNYKYPFEWSLKVKSDNTLFPGAEGLDNDTMRAYFCRR
ncbi:MAG: extracellular solute-binding protein [Clostridiales bacterium]|nr:MAG: extracellular solute-binding protein [Clostridiales bacterium]